MKKPRKEKPVLEPVSEDGNSKFARALGSTDYQTREKGLQALTLWLCRRSDLAEADMLKIWKGLFFCFWHSDKAPVQVQVHLLTQHRLWTESSLEAAAALAHKPSAFLWLVQDQLAQRLAGILVQLSGQVGPLEATGLKPRRDVQFPQCYA